MPICAVKTLYLVRGLPGAGKTTAAKRIHDLVVEADDFFVGADGIYRYDKTKIIDAHAWCQKRVGELMAAGDPVVVVANTFTRRWEMEWYYGMAQVLGYTVKEVPVVTDLSDEELAARNVHGVPVGTITAMRQRWQA